MKDEEKEEEKEKEEEGNDSDDPGSGSDSDGLESAESGQSDEYEVGDEVRLTDTRRRKGKGMVEDVRCVLARLRLTRLSRQLGPGPVVWNLI